MEICGERDRFRGDKIAIAPLRIAKHNHDLEELDRFGHFRHRKDMAQYSANKPQSSIVCKQLFYEAKSVATTNSKFCSTWQAKEKFILTHGNIVFLIGQAGIGKTSLSKELVREMLDLNEPLFGAEIVFYIKFRDVNYSKDITLLQYLTSGCPILQNYNSEEQEKILKMIQEQEENVYIVMDGFDEAGITEISNQTFYSIDEKEKAEVIIANLIRGDLLRGSKKIITSRPRQLIPLSEECEFYFIADILGINSAGLKQICSNLCGEDANLQKEILKFINSNSDLKSFCSVPINAILTVRTLRATSEWNNFTSLTTIIVTALDVWFLTKLGKIPFQCRKISILAYSGFLEGRFYFSSNDLEEVGINFQNLTTFLSTHSKFQLLEGTEVISYFAHLMWQEFFVALKLWLYSTADEFKRVCLKLSSEKFEVVTRFLFGLCNVHVSDRLLRIIEVEGRNSPIDREECKEVLKKFAVDEFTRLATIDKQYFSSIFPILECIYELKDNGFAKQVAACLKEDIKTNLKFSQSAMPSFSYVLQSRETPLVLFVKTTFYAEHHISKFKELCIAVSKNDNIKVSKLV